MAELLLKQFDLPAVSREKMREIDDIAINQYKIPSIVLMERAGLAVSFLVEQEVEFDKTRKIAVVCGKGNNGGDGLVCARNLFNRGYYTKIYLISRIKDILEKGTDPAINLTIAIKHRLPIFEICTQEDAITFSNEIKTFDMIVDAIFGTGLASPPQGLERQIIHYINEAGIKVIAVDIPSGLDANTGEPLQVSIKAYKTVTMGLLKIGLLVQRAKEYTGEVYVADIGVPKDIIATL